MTPLRHVVSKLPTIKFSEWEHGFTEQKGEEQDTHKMTNAIGHGVVVAMLKSL